MNLSEDVWDVFDNITSIGQTFLPVRDQEIYPVVMFSVLLEECMLEQSVSGCDMALGDSIPIHISKIRRKFTVDQSLVDGVIGESPVIGAQDNERSGVLQEHLEGL